jgi:hypothetical protein
MPQADNWAAIKPAVTKLREAVDEMPSPPTPDDEYSQKRNDLNRTVSGLEEQVQGRVQMEEELDDL